MATNNPYSHYNHSAVQFQANSSAYDLNDKLPFDDLASDENRQPFDRSSSYSAYNLGAKSANPLDHSRRPSLPLHNMATKHSYDTSDYSHAAYPPSPAPAPESDNRSFWKKILPDSLACRLFVLTVIVETIIDLTIEGILLLKVHEQAKLEGASAEVPTSDQLDNEAIAERSMSAYLALFAVAHVFQLLMALDAVYRRNTLQFMFLILLNALFLIAALVQIRELKEIPSVVNGTGAANIPITVLTTIIPIIIALAEVAYVALGWKIYNEFGWQVFKFLGADRRIKKLYAKYQVYECLIKFDVFFFAAFSIEFIYLVLQKDDWEFYITCAALPLSLILLVEGHLAAKHENKLMMVMFMFGCIGAMVYFVYKLVKVLLLKETQHIFHFTWKTLTVFAVLAIILLFATFVLSIMIMQNFGRGLKEALIKKDHAPSDPHRRNASTHLNRMSIG